MQYFRNMEQPESTDIRQHPSYATLSDENRKTVDETYNSTFLNNQRLGLKIATGMAYAAAKQVCESVVAEKHVGFQKLKHDLESQGKSAESAGAIAHSIGVKKYGSAAMNKASATHKPLGEDEVAEAEIQEDDLAEGGWGKESRERKRGPWFGIERGNSKQKKALHHFKDDARYNHLKQSSRDRADGIKEDEEDEKYAPGATYESEADTETDNGAADIQKVNTMKYKPSGDEKKDAAADKKDDDKKDDDNLVKGAAEILKKNHGDKGMKDKEITERELSVPEQHQLAVARKTLKMNDAMAGVMGGMSKEQARQVIARLTGKPVKEDDSEDEQDAPGPTYEQADSVISAAAKYIGYRAECAGTGKVITEGNTKGKK